MGQRQSHERLRSISSFPRQGRSDRSGSGTTRKISRFVLISTRRTSSRKRSSATSERSCTRVSSATCLGVSSTTSTTSLRFWRSGSTVPSASLTTTSSTKTSSSRSSVICECGKYERDWEAEHWMIWSRSWLAPSTRRFASWERRWVGCCSTSSSRSCGDRKYSKKRWWRRRSWLRSSPLTSKASRGKSRPRVWAGREDEASPPTRLVPLASLEFSEWLAWLFFKINVWGRAESSDSEAPWKCEREGTPSLLRRRSEEVFVFLNRVSSSQKVSSLFLTQARLKKGDSRAASCISDRGKTCCIWWRHSTGLLTSTRRVGGLSDEQGTSSLYKWKRRWVATHSVNSTKTGSWSQLDTRRNKVWLRFEITQTSCRSRRKSRRETRLSSPVETRKNSRRSSSWFVRMRRGHTTATAAVRTSQRRRKDRQQQQQQWRSRLSFSTCWRTSSSSSSRVTTRAGSMFTRRRISSRRARRRKSQRRTSGDARKMTGIQENRRRSRSLRRRKRREKRDDWRKSECLKRSSPTGRRKPPRRQRFPLTSWKALRQRRSRRQQKGGVRKERRRVSRFCTRTDLKRSQDIRMENRTKGRRDSDPPTKRRTTMEKENTWASTGQEQGTTTGHRDRLQRRCTRTHSWTNRRSSTPVIRTTRQGLMELKLWVCRLRRVRLHLCSHQCWSWIQVSSSHHREQVVKEWIWSHCWKEQRHLSHPRSERSRSEAD